MQRYQARMPENVRDGGRQRPEREPISRHEGRGNRPLFCSSVIVAGAEHDRHKMRDVGGVKRAAAGQAHFNGAAAGHVGARQARGQRRGVIRNKEIAWAQKFDERFAWDVAEISV